MKKISTLKKKLEKSSPWSPDPHFLHGPPQPRWGPVAKELVEDLCSSKFVFCFGSSWFHIKFCRRSLKSSYFQSSLLLWFTSLKLAARVCISRHSVCRANSWIHLMHFSFAFEKVNSPNHDLWFMQKIIFLSRPMSSKKLITSSSSAPTSELAQSSTSSPWFRTNFDFLIQLQTGQTHTK